MCSIVRDFILINNRGAVNRRLRNSFKGRGHNIGVFVGGGKGGGGGGGITWTLILRIFRMAFFFCPPPPPP